MHGLHCTVQLPFAVKRFDFVDVKKLKKTAVRCILANIPYFVFLNIVFDYGGSVVFLVLFCIIIIIIIINKTGCFSYFYIALVITTKTVP
uniref:Uncharacterized protein n=1 Tax=Anguilla anguilla TaxID=7936 RepID=A0A0E9WU75_ANGAN